METKQLYEQGTAFYPATARDAIINSVGGGVDVTTRPILFLDNKLKQIRYKNTIINYADVADNGIIESIINTLPIICLIKTSNLYTFYDLCDWIKFRSKDSENFPRYSIEYNAQNYKVTIRFYDFIYYANAKYYLNFNLDSNGIEFKASYDNV